MTDRRQTQIRVVLPQEQPVFGSGRHHPVWLMAFFCHKIIDENADISLGTVDHDAFLPLQLPSRIDPGDQPLCRRFLVTGTSVKLSAAEEALNVLEFQRRLKLAGVYAVVFDGICIPHDLRIFKPRHAPVHGVLDVLGKGAGHAAHVHFRRVDPFRFDKHLMAVLIREFHHFILDGRTIPGTGPFDRAGKERRPVQIVPDDLVGRLICIGQPAGHLVDLHIIRIRCKGKGHDALVAFLLFHPAEINGIPVDAGRCPGLEPVHLYPQGFQAVRQIIGALQAIRPGVHTDIAVNAPGFQISSGTQDHRPAVINGAGIGLDSCNMPVFCEQVRHFHLADVKPRLRFQHLPHGPAVVCFIRLGAKRMDGRTFGLVQHLGLDESPVDDLSHLSAQGVHFPHQMSF